MQIVSRIAAMIVMALAMAFGGAAAFAAELQASKAVYSTAPGDALFQSVSNKPCCFDPNSGLFRRFSGQTCWRLRGQLVDDRFCRGGYDNRWGGGQNWHDPRYNPPQHWQDPRYHQPQPWQDPRWGGGHSGYSLCCKRGRKEWWVQSVWECSNRRRGAIVHPSLCYK